MKSNLIKRKWSKNGTFYTDSEAHPHIMHMLNVTVILANINIVQKENPDSEKQKHHQSLQSEY